MRQPITAFGFAVLGFYVLLWGAQWIFPRDAAGSAVLVLATMGGVALVRPGRNIKPRGQVGYGTALFGLLLGSAVLAASVLRLSKIPTPYETTSLNIVRLLPGIITVTGVEELLFRQVLFRWLEMQCIAGKAVVISTSVAFGGAHLGPLLIGGEVGGPFIFCKVSTWSGSVCCSGSFAERLIRGSCRGPVTPATMWRSCSYSRPGDL